MKTLGEQRKTDVFILQIGAMDGKTFDPVHEYITRFQWSGLLVEPIGEHFENLKHNYENYVNIALANVAIGEKDGSTIMHRVSSENIAAEHVPKWGPGLASFYTDRNALAFEGVKPFMQEDEVNCLTLPSLLKQHKISKIDVLQIDAEGHDYHILKQLDFRIYKPMVIHLEIVNLPKAEQTACKKLLDEWGYIHAKCGYDLLAVSKQFFGAFPTV